MSINLRTCPAFEEEVPSRPSETKAIRQFPPQCIPEPVQFTILHDAQPIVVLFEQIVLLRYFCVIGSLGALTTTASAASKLYRISQGREKTTARHRNSFVAFPAHPQMCR